MPVEKPAPFAWEHDAYKTNYHDCGLTGYTGLDYHTVARLSVMPAARSQIGTRGFYKAGLAELPNGDLLASPVNMLEEQEPMRRPAATWMAKSWRVHLMKSKDKGWTWRPVEDHTPLWGKEGAIVRTERGELLLMTESMNAIAWSGDGGRKWEVTWFDIEKDADYQLVPPCRNVITHPDGTISFLRCLGTIEGTGPQDGSAPPKCRAWLYHSTDGGRTWPDRTEIETWDDTFPLFAEADFCRLPDGRILAASRFEWLHPIPGKPLPYAPGTMPNDHAAGHMVLTESSDEGRTWSAPRDFLSYSEVQGQLTLLQDGRLLCTYTHYHLPFGVAAVMSCDNGATWDFARPFQLALSNAACTGWATTRELRDGTLLTVYALEPYHLEPKESGATVCHCVRWEMPA